jgi:hypothetical protein
MTLLQKIARAAAVLTLVLLLAGCRSMFESEYTYSEMYDAKTQTESQAEGVEVKNYAQLCSALQNMIADYDKHGVLLFSNYNGSVSDDMAAACYEVKTTAPLGAYAVEELDYELDRIVSYYTADISIRFRRTHDEVDSVITLNGTAELRTAVTGAMGAGQNKLTVRVYSSAVSEQYITDMITDAYFDQPLLCAEQPAPEVKSYPSEGFNRIYEISFGFTESPERLAGMKSELTEAVSAMSSAAYAESNGAFALRLAEQLYRSCAESDSPANDTAYGALVEHEAGSTGMAMAYKALCMDRGIDCLVVRGSIVETRMYSHGWNIITLDGDSYHVDVSRLNTYGRGAMFLASDLAMWGRYVWDTEHYPACAGRMCYADLVPAAEGGEDTSGETAEPTPEPSAEPAPDPNTEPGYGLLGGVLRAENRL